MSKIIPHLWFDKEAKEAAALYTSLFPQSKVTHSSVIRNTPSGDCDVVSFKLWDQEFMAISAGPYFKHTPAISFMVNFDPLFFDGSEENAKKALDAAWEKLSKKGQVRMELGEYPFSKHYGWVADEYGVDWQLILTDPDGEKRPAIMPTLLFVTESSDVAMKATDFYMSIFKNSKRGAIAHAPSGQNGVMFTDFMLEGQWFVAMDGSSDMHKFNFNEAISFMVNCEDQEEINYFFEKLSAVPESEQCGWLKDNFGLSWQIVPRMMSEMMSSGSREQVDNLTQTMLKMKKLDIEDLKRAFDGRPRN